MRPTAPRPESPTSAQDWVKLNTDERRERLNAHRQALTDWWITGNGLVRLDKYEPGARRCCVECLAGGSAQGYPLEGVDSHGDCSADGEPIWWVLPVVPLPSIDTPEKAARLIVEKGRPGNTAPDYERAARSVMTSPVYLTELFHAGMRWARNDHDGFMEDLLMEAVQVVRRAHKEA